MRVETIGQNSFNVSNSRRQSASRSDEPVVIADVLAVTLWAAAGLVVSLLALSQSGADAAASIVIALSI